jgi:hypothetical protein
MLSLPDGTPKGYPLLLSMGCSHCWARLNWSGRLGDAVRETRKYGHLRCE